MPRSCIRVARGLLLYGEQIHDGSMDRERFMNEIGVKNGSFRNAGLELGATIKTPGQTITLELEMDVIYCEAVATLTLQ